MLIIWGSKWKIKEEGSINLICDGCQEEELMVCSTRRWFTLFFIPVIPTSSKEYYLHCLSCENSYELENSINIEELLNDQDANRD